MPRPSPHVVGRRLDDRFVVVNLRTNRIFELNRTASVLWELLEEGADGTELEARLGDRFEVETDTLAREIRGTLRALTDAGLVRAA